MKKIFLVLFILISGFLFLSLTKVEAQTPTPTGQSIQIPGLTCGDAEGATSEIKRCCLSPKLNFIQKFSISPDLCVINEGPVRWGCPGNFINKFVSFLADLPEVKQLNDQYLPELSKDFNPCINGNPSTPYFTDPSCVCKTAPATTEYLCEKYLKNSADYGKCVACSSNGIWTSIGCVKNDLSSFIQDTVFGFGIGLAGGFSLLCIIYAAFMMQSSQGNPEKLKKAQEMITSCIMGLMLIIFSVFILRLIGVNILKIPGFG